MIKFHFCATFRVRFTFNIRSLVKHSKLFRSCFSFSDRLWTLKIDTSTFLRLKDNTFFFKVYFISFYFIQVWFQNRRMKDKRQRMAVTWPYGIPPDPQIYAYLAAAAASYPYALPNPATVSYPSLPLPGLYQSQTGSSAFSPLAPQSALKPMFDTLPPFPGSLSASSALDRLSAATSEATSIDSSLSQRYKNENPTLGALPSIAGLKTGCPCGLPTCSLSSGLHPSFPASIPSSLHPGFHPSLTTSLPTGIMSAPLNPLFQKTEFSKH